MDYIQYIRKKVGHDMIIMVGCGVFPYKDGKVLLQRRKDNNCWACHGGGMNIGETPEEVAKRELLEETGLVAEKLELLGVFSGSDMLYTYPNDDQVCIVAVSYVCQEFSGNLLAQRDEVSELKWFDIDDIPHNISPPDRQTMAAFVKWAKAK
ncbi:MAG: NUDIX hydrolase [Defluviitaleaceae bacterium]|nr:NUDIX hydrolase [Defluviitaleaceae bacterium]